MNIANVGFTPTLTINVQVSSVNYKLYRIDIDSQDTYISNGPSANPVWSKQYVGGTSITEVIPTTSLEGACLNKDVIFVYVQSVPNTFNPASADARNDIDVQCFMIYKKEIELIKAMQHCNWYSCEQNRCKRNEGLINHILQCKALQYAMEAGDSDRVKCYWDKWFKAKSECGNSQPCGCQ